MFKLIIAGSRNINDYETIATTADKLLINKIKAGEAIEIVSGHARGVDSLGERYANERGFQLKLFPADWDTYGKSAGYRRNKEMAKYADALLAFWDGESRGTKHMIDLAQEHGLQVRIIRKLNNPTQRSSS